LDLNECFSDLNDSLLDRHVCSSRCKFGYVRWNALLSSLLIRLGLADPTPNARQTAIISRTLIDREADQLSISSDLLSVQMLAGGSTDIVSLLGEVLVH
jgi:hypothetical protein